MTDTMPDWIALELGPRRARAWAMSAQGDVLDSITTDRPRDGQDIGLPDHWHPDRCPVLATGPVQPHANGTPAPLQPVPAKPGDLRPRAAPSGTMPNLMIMPGLSQSAPPDLMQTGATRLAAILGVHPQFDGVVLFPGETSHWAHVSAEEVVSFQSCATGELFAAITGTPRPRAPDHDNPAFGDAVSETMSRPERLAARIASTRADAVLNDTDPATLTARLAGALIGAELAAARPYWLGQEVLIADDAPLSAGYAAALSAQSVAARLIPGDLLALQGLIRFWNARRAQG